MIVPSIGRVVLFYPSGSLPHEQPLPAIVTGVWGDRCINIAVFERNGVPRSHPPTSVMLLQDDEPAPVDMAGNVVQHCAWMPYQRGQAAKYDALKASVN